MVGTESGCRAGPASSKPLPLTNRDQHGSKISCNSTHCIWNRVVAAVVKLSGDGMSLTAWIVTFQLLTRISEGTAAAASSPRRTPSVSQPSPPLRTQPRVSQEHRAFAATTPHVSSKHYQNRHHAAQRHVCPRARATRAPHAAQRRVCRTHDQSITTDTPPASNAAAHATA